MKVLIKTTSGREYLFYKRNQRLFYQTNGIVHEKIPCSSLENDVSMSDIFDVINPKRGEKSSKDHIVSAKMIVE